VKYPLSRQKTGGHGSIEKKPLINLTIVRVWKPLYKLNLIKILGFPAHFDQKKVQPIRVIVVLVS